MSKQVKKDISSNHDRDYTKVVKKKMDQYLFSDDNCDDEKEIHDICDYDLNGLLSYINIISNEPLFLEGVKELCNSHGYLGNGTRKSYCAFIVDKAIKNNVLSPDDKRAISSFRQTINNWLRDDEKRETPKDSKDSRQNVYKLCFALELSYEEVCVFFRKKYLCMPFNLRNLDEAVYQYVLKNKLGYEKALYILNKCNDYINHDNNMINDDSIISTRSFGEFSEGVDLEDFIQACCVNKNYFNHNKESIVNKIWDLMHELMNKYGIENKRLEIKNIPKMLHYIYYGEDVEINHLKAFRDENGKPKDDETEIELVKKFRKYSYKFGKTRINALPPKLAKNMPSEAQFARIYRGESVSPDVLRKMLILLVFFNYYLGDSDDTDNIMTADYETFVISLDSELCKYGFMQSYIGNPYDWIFHFCAKHDDEEGFDPIEVFQTLMMYYTSASNVSEEK